MAHVRLKWRDQRYHVVIDTLESGSVDTFKAQATYLRLQPGALIFLAIMTDSTNSRSITPHRRASAPRLETPPRPRRASRYESQSEYPLEAITEYMVCDRCDYVKFVRRCIIVFGNEVAQKCPCGHVDSVLELINMNHRAKGIGPVVKRLAQGLPADLNIFMTVPVINL